MPTAALSMAPLAEGDNAAGAAPSSSDSMASILDSDSDTASSSSTDSEYERRRRKVLCFRRSLCFAYWRILFAACHENLTDSTHCSSGGLAVAGPASVSWPWNV